ncbi:elongation factor 1-delta isoform X2 [Trichoplusia ni]|uniref:Elongation factor 1-delta isoform X2 n=1 Tax=Trichoplusia ni TaxID=7111 RepID=A0A7E5VSJ9_TRINI|nr:elongation factor 1-delta isoform X2 [Trichoplusia ni]
MTTLIHEKIWLDKNIYNDAEKNYYESLSKMDSVATLAGVPNTELTSKVNTLEKENSDLKKAINDLRNLVISLQARVETLESTGGGAKTESSKAPASNAAPAATAAPAKVQDDDDDDGVDLFGSDDEEESAEAARIREERLAAYNAKKSKKPVLIAKSNIILDVKPWDDETDMVAMEKAVRGIETDGLLWGAAKLVPLAYGIHKLQISCVVEDDKVSVDWLTEELEKFEDFVQSVDIAAFNKV